MESEDFVHVVIGEPSIGIPLILVEAMMAKGLDGRLLVGRENKSVVAPPSLGSRIDKPYWDAYCSARFLASSWSARMIHSAAVELVLGTQQAEFPLAKIGPSRAVLKAEGHYAEPGDGEIVMVVDGVEKRWRVVLPNGVVPFDRSVEIRDRA